MSAERICSIDSCDRPLLVRSYCSTHYWRWYRHGDPMRGPKTLAERFEAKFNAGGPDECWLWTGAALPTGYGFLTENATILYAHRFSYELSVGPIPAGLEIDHLCNQRGCVNPRHLEPVTHAENVRRAHARRRTA